MDDKNFLLEENPYFADLDYDNDNQHHGVMTNHVITPSDEEYGNMITNEQPEADNEEAVDKYLSCEIIMDVGSGNEQKGRVTKRSRGHDGKPIGVAHNNPLFDTRKYDVEFTDGSVENYATADNMFTQIDDEGR